MPSDHTQDNLGETRSLKVLSPGTVISHYKIIEKTGEARERFEHEAKAASALNHPGIAAIYEIDEVEGRCKVAGAYAYLRKCPT